MTRRMPLLAAIVVLAAGSAGAHVHPVVGTKLIVVQAASGHAKTVFVAKDTNVIKGTGTDAALIDTVLDVDTGASHGSFVAPAGVRWRLNTAGVARYVNTAAPGGGAVKVTVVKPGKLIKLIAKSLGDEPLDLSLAPASTIYAAYSVTNGNETHRHCTQFSSCAYMPIGGGAGHKLLCKKASTGDPACQAIPPTSTTSTVASTTSTSEPTTTSTSLTTTTLQIASSVDCCQGTGQCVAGLGFSLNFQSGPVLQRAAARQHGCAGRRLQRERYLRDPDDRSATQSLLPGEHGRRTDVLRHGGARQQHRGRMVVPQLLRRRPVRNCVLRLGMRTGRHLRARVALTRRVPPSRRAPRRSAGRAARA